MKYLFTAILVLILGCNQPNPPCRSGVIPNRLRQAAGYSCDTRSKSFALHDGSVVCICPEDVSKLTK